MRTVFISSLLNGLCGDPGLWVDLLDEGRSVLLDLGELRHVASRKLLRVERAVVTHTHMDHFIGFDHLLRLAQVSVRLILSIEDLEPKSPLLTKKTLIASSVVSVLQYALQVLLQEKCGARRADRT